MNRTAIATCFVLIAGLGVQAQDTTVQSPQVAKESEQSEASNVASSDGEGRQSVKPGINDSFLDPELNVQEWVERFEVESREVYQARDEIMRQLKLKPGMRIADVGAGTGFYSILMSEAVGNDGWVYAIDISPKFVEHLAQQFDKRSISNATTVMCDDDSICLPPDSIDAAFICDVYHHFEYPLDTMGSIYLAMKPGGRVTVIDFERIPGVSREWTLGHVRAGKQTFINEIEEAGFEFVAERQIPGFKENYCLEFQKPLKSK